MDPNTSTREQFTNSLLDLPIPDNATETWRKYASNSKQLLRRLAFHDAMQPNLQQTYMTPANSKNKVYFMWDFVGRTLGMVYALPPTSTPETSQGNAKNAWKDVVSRSSMAAELILDSNPGMLDMMVTSTYPRQPGNTPQFDEETLEIARRLKA